MLGVSSCRRYAQVEIGKVDPDGCLPYLEWTFMDVGWAHLNDENQPEPEVVFDNVKFRYYETPPISIGIEKTVRLHWPAFQATLLHM